MSPEQISDLNRNIDVGIIAYQQGCEWVWSLKPGDVFQGAGPRATALGYARGSTPWTMFVSGAWDALHDVHTDPQGIITCVDCDRPVPDPVANS